MIERLAVRRALVFLAIVYAALQTRAIFTESVNWDEFAMVHRTAAFVRLGQLQGGGRPGIVELFVAPFVRGCHDAVTAVREARVLWWLITIALLSGVFVMTRRLRRGSGLDAAGVFAVALMIGVPAFQRWSLQVRTDQPAAALAIWGGVALLASRDRRGRAFVAGFVWVVGALVTQKAAYLIALAGLLGALDLWLVPEASDGARLRRALTRALLVLLGGGVAFAAYRLVLPMFFALPRRVLGVEQGLNTFKLYRDLFGFVVYRGMLPTLVPHLALVAALAFATVRGTGEIQARRSLFGAWAVLALGLGVGLFHAAAFPYFWITLGVFPAVAGALGFDAIRESLPTPRVRSLVAAAFSAGLVTPALWTGLRLQEDTQAVQRESLAFIDRAFPPGARGFHAEGALSCREDPAPFPILFTENIVRLFGGADRDAKITEMQAEFRSRPVDFIVATHVFHQFPLEMREFWGRHYVPYAAQVFVPGRVVSGDVGATSRFEVLHAGAFRWFLPPGLPQARLSVDARPIAPGGVLQLEAGVHILELVEETQGGLFSLAIDEPPSPGEEPFYSAIQIAEITGSAAP